MRRFPRNFPVATVSPPPKGIFTRVEVSALKHAGMPGLHGSSPLLRLQSDERLVALIRRGNHGAFEALVSRYQSRLHAFCRHMLGSREDAEDVLQEVFAAAFNAMQADERPLNVRPWLYRIARNRSLNHLRKQQPIGVDSMDVHYSEGGLTTADKVHKREDFRLLLVDVQSLPETQRTALLLREIDALSYDQISEAMDTTVPSVKSLLVRARVSLAEAAEARQLSCQEVRLELGEVAEGLKKMPPPVRRHVKTCDRCAAFKTTLRDTNKALAAIFPVGPLLLFKKLVLAHLGTTASGGGATAASTAGASAAGSAAASSAISAGVSALASKAAAGVAAAAIVTAGAVEVRQATVAGHQGVPAAAALSTGGVAAPASASASDTQASVAHPAKPKTHRKAVALVAAKPATTTNQATTPTPPPPAPVPAPEPAAQPAPQRTQTVTNVVTLPAAPTAGTEKPAGSGGDTSGGPPGETGSGSTTTTAPPVGEGGPPPSPPDDGTPPPTDGSPPAGP
jgi:RNA polymerase sigma factor (sigma-70 family)